MAGFCHLAEIGKLRLRGRTSDTGVGCRDGVTLVQRAPKYQTPLLCSPARKYAMSHNLPSCRTYKSATVRPETPANSPILSRASPVDGPGNFPSPPNCVAFCRSLAASFSIGSSVRHCLKVFKLPTTVSEDRLTNTKYTSLLPPPARQTTISPMKPANRPPRLPPDSRWHMSMGGRCLGFQRRSVGCYGSPGPRPQSIADPTYRTPASLITFSGGGVTMFSTSRAHRSSASRRSSRYW